MPLSDANRINEMYFGRYGSEATHRLTRARVHWMGSQATGRRVLDVGCSQGIVALLLGREGFEVLALDVHAPSIEYARTALAEEDEPIRRRVRYTTTAGDFSDVEETFDTVMMGEVIEHLVQPERLVAAIVPLLDPGGRLVLTTPLGVHLAPDHKEPLRPSQVRDLLAPHFRLNAWTRFDDHESDVQYLGFSCSLDPGSDDNKASYAEAVAGLAEDGLVSTQWKLNAARSRLHDRQSTVNALRKEAEGLRAARDATSAQLTTTRQEVTAVSKAHEQLQETCRRARAAHRRDEELLHRLRSRRIVRLADALGRVVAPFRGSRRD